MRTEILAVFIIFISFKERIKKLYFCLKNNKKNTKNQVLNLIFWSFKGSATGCIGRSK